MFFKIYFFKILKINKIKRLNIKVNKLIVNFKLNKGEIYI